MLARNLLISMVPAVISGMTNRTAALILLTSLHAMGEAWYQPWLSCTNNVVEISMSLLLMLVAIGALVGQEDGPAESMFGLTTVSFCLIWVLFVVASLWTIMGQHTFFKSHVKAQNKAMCEKLASVAGKLSAQDEAEESKRVGVISSLSWYDRNALKTALSLIEDEVLDDSKSKYKRVRFSFLRSKGDAAKVVPADAWAAGDKPGDAPE